MDVVALNWQDKAILLGECKWGVEPVARSVICELADKAPRIVPGKGWAIHLAFFARAGFTEAARSKAASLGAQQVDLAQLDDDLGHLA